MKAQEYEKMYRAENRFWWFSAKGQLVKELAAKWFPLPCRGLDLGCGTGANLERLSRRGEWWGADLASEAMGFCAERGHRTLVRADCARLPFADGSFDAATALDILEHFEDDRAAAAEAFRVLRPGGRLLVTAPAYPSLWSSHDRVLGHQRRYTRTGLAQLLAGAGFRLSRLTHFMGLLFPAMALVRRLQRRPEGKEDTISYDWPGPLNWMLLMTARLEIMLLRWFDMPFGTTLVAIGEKPGGKSGAEE